MEEKLMQLIAANMSLCQARSAYNLAVEEFLADPNPYAPDFASDIRSVMDGQSVVVIKMGIDAYVEQVAFTGLLTIDDQGDVLAIDPESRTHSLMQMGILPYLTGWGRHVFSVSNDLASLRATCAWLISQGGEALESLGVLEEYIREEFPAPKSGWETD